MTRLRDALAAERRPLPWIWIEKDCVFDGPIGRVSLSDPFDGRSQLFVKLFMMGPGATQRCVGCSLLCSAINLARSSPLLLRRARRGSGQTPSLKDRAAPVFMRFTA